MLEHWYYKWESLAIFSHFNEHHIIYIYTWCLHLFVYPSHKNFFQEMTRSGSFFERSFYICSCCLHRRGEIWWKSSLILIVFFSHLCWVYGIVIWYSALNRDKVEGRDKLEARHVNVLFPFFRSFRFHMVSIWQHWSCGSRYAISSFHFHV